jgi:hypothetical protein
MQTEIAFAACAVENDHTPVWKRLLRAMLIRRLERVPWISILELREITQCQSADVRIRELRRKLDRAAANLNNLESQAMFYLVHRNLMSQVNIYDAYLPAGAGLANIRSSIATFRVKHGDEWLWVYLLTMDEKEIEKIVGPLWN